MDETRCTCGSGGHPRRCAKHPGAFEAHVDNLNAIQFLENAEDEFRALGLHDGEAAACERLAGRMPDGGRLSHSFLVGPWVGLAEARRFVWDLLSAEDFVRLSDDFRDEMLRVVPR